MDNALTLSATRALLIVALALSHINIAGETMSNEVAGVWTDGTLKVVNDVYGLEKAIT